MMKHLMMLKHLYTFIFILIFFFSFVIIIFFFCCEFKAPSFVRKHIETKHQDKLEKVKLETEYFNSYLADPRRPQLAEHPFNKTGHKNAQANQHSSNDHHLTGNSQSSYSGGGNSVYQRINFGNQSNNRYNSGNSNWNNSYNNYNNYNRNNSSRFNNRSV